jgi:hypothetical protein
MDSLEPVLGLEGVLGEFEPLVVLVVVYKEKEDVCL